MKSRSRRLWPAMSLGFILMSACSLLPPPQPDPSKFYVLTALSGPASDAAPPGAADLSHLAIGLGPVTLPEYLHRREVVTRAAPNRLDLSATDFWAEPLDESFRRVLEENLSILLGTKQIVEFPWYSTTVLDYQVQVEVQRFECDGSGNAQLHAVATVKDPKSGQVLTSQQANLSEAAGSASAEARAAALSNDLGNLSRQIADEVRRAQAEHPHPSPTQS